jgi:hypothetical protein
LRKLESTISGFSDGLSKESKTVEARNQVLSLMLNELNNNKLDVQRVEGFYSYILSYRLEDLIKSKNWFVGVILSEALLDDAGKRKLKRKFKGKIDGDKLARLTFEQTLILLFASNLIDQKTYERMNDVKNLRNQLAHDSFKALTTFLETGSIQNKSCQKSRAVIRKAIKCLKAINPPINP